MTKTGHLHGYAAPLLSGVRLRVFDSMEPAKPAWLLLERAGLATVYQCFAWCEGWLLHVATVRKATPVIVLAEDASGKPLFLLPLQMRRKAGVRIVEGLTAPQGAYGSAIVAEAFATQAASWFATHFPDVLAALPPHDVFRLADIPAEMGKRPNPLLSIRHFQAANIIHIMDLQAEYQTLLERKRSAETRRSMRKRDARLVASGSLSFGLPATAEETSDTIAQMFDDQEKRLSAIGVHNVFDAAERRFIRHLALVAKGVDDKAPLLRPYRLKLDETTLAVMLGAHFQNTYWALVSSLAEGALMKFSPGEYALRQLIRTLCEDNTAVLDFSAGNTAYKHFWSDRTMPLHVIVQARSLRGLPVAGFMLLREQGKRFAKNTPALHSLLFRLRQMMVS